MYRTVPGRQVRTRSVATVCMLLILGLAAAACGDDDPAPEVPGASAPPVTASPSAAADEGPGLPAADALYFYPPVTGATLTMANGGAASGTTEVTVDAISSDSDGYTVTVTEVVSGSGESVTVQREFLTSADGSLVIGAEEFGAFGGDTEVTAAGDDVRIPAIGDLEAGATATGDTFVEISGPGFTSRMDVTYTVSGAGYTSVTVPAGTMDAYVVEIVLDIDNSLAGRVTGDGRYWFVPGFGLVRQEMSIAGNTLTTELVASSVPLP